MTVQVQITEQSIPTDNLLFGPTSTSDYAPDENWTAALVVATFILIFVGILVRRAIEKYLSDILMTRLNSIMKDAIIIVTAVTFILYLDYLSEFDKRLDVCSMCLLFLVFALSWLTLSAVLILIAQAFCVKWEENEAAVPKRGKLLTALFFCKL